MTQKFPYSGQTFTIKMDNGLEVKNTYHASESIITIEFLNGEMKGTLMNVPYKWRELSGGNYLVSWQESDNNTVVHCDNFNKGISYAYYTTMEGEFYVMEGEIR
ncbi:MoaF-related domain-containing protein [Vibrio owensii]|uniref:MoaF-related domain-containing protein n=1 Tax=Vibrio owensii TaxID=696485 RepID=UPI004067D2D1